MSFFSHLPISFSPSFLNKLPFDSTTPSKLSDHKGQIIPQGAVQEATSYHTPDIWHKTFNWSLNCCALYFYFISYFFCHSLPYFGISLGLSRKRFAFFFNQYHFHSFRLWNIFIYFHFIRGCLIELASFLYLRDYRLKTVINLWWWISDHKF